MSRPKRHPIDRYCKRERIARAELARRADVSPQFLRDVVAGRRRLGRLSALALIEATDGALRLDELIVPDPPNAAGAAA